MNRLNELNWEEQIHHNWNQLHILLHQSNKQINNIMEINNTQRETCDWGIQQRNASGEMKHNENYSCGNLNEIVFLFYG